MFKPVILLGNGCRRNPALIEYIRGLGIPVLLTWMAADMLTDDDPVYCGRPGVLGQRAANIIQQKADVIIVLGARLDNEQVGYNLDNFAPRAKWVIVYDIDEAELLKLPNGFYKIKRNLTNYVMSDFSRWDRASNPKWLDWCKRLYNDMHKRDFHGGVYDFVASLPGNHVYANCSSGTLINVFLQAYRVQKGDRIMNLCSMGTMGAEGIAIGAAVGLKRPVICLAGDGGFAQSATAVLEGAKRYDLPITFYVAMNEGYGSIRSSQMARFGRKTGADPESGFELPDIRLIAHACGYYTYSAVTSTVRLVDLPENFTYACRVASSLKDGVMTTDPMEDMSPRLDPAELKELMEYGN